MIRGMAASLCCSVLIFALPVLGLKRNEQISFSNKTLNKSEAAKYCGSTAMTLPVHFSLRDIESLKGKEQIHGKTITVWMGMHREKYTKWTSHDGQKSNMPSLSGIGGCRSYVTTGKYRRVNCLTGLSGFLCKASDCTRCYDKTCIYEDKDDTCLRLGFGQLNWYQARKECRLMGGYLLNSTEEQIKGLSKIINSLEEEHEVWTDWSKEDWFPEENQRGITEETDYDFKEESTGKCLTLQLGRNGKWKFPITFCNETHNVWCVYGQVNSVSSTTEAVTKDTMRELHTEEDIKNPGHGHVHYIYVIAASASTAIFISLCACVCRGCKHSRKESKTEHSIMNTSLPRSPVSPWMTTNELENINRFSYLDNTSGYNKLSADHVFRAPGKTKTLGGRAAKMSRSMTSLLSPDVTMNHTTDKRESTNRNGTEYSWERKLSQVMQARASGCAVTYPKPSTNDTYECPWDTLSADVTKQGENTEPDYLGILSELDAK